MERVLKSKKDIEKEPTKVQNNEWLIYEQLGEALKQFENNLNGNDYSGSFKRPERDQIKLTDLQQKTYKKPDKQYIDFDESITDHENDKVVIDQWDKKDQ